MGKAQQAGFWSWKVLKYVFLAVVFLILLVVILILLLNNRKKEAENLKRRLAVAKADADISYLDAKKKLEQEKLEPITEEAEKIEKELVELRKKRDENLLLIEGMTNEEVAAELARRGY